MPCSWTTTCSSPRAGWNGCARPWTAPAPAPCPLASGAWTARCSPRPAPVATARWWRRSAVARVSCSVPTSVYASTRRTSAASGTTWTSCSRSSSWATKPMSMAEWTSITTTIPRCGVARTWFTSSRSGSARAFCVAGRCTATSRAPLSCPATAATISSEGGRRAEMLIERAPLSGTETAVSTSPRPVTLDAGGQRVYAMYRPATGEPPPGVHLAVLLLEQQGSHRMNVRLARALAAAGYPSLAVDFRCHGESEGQDDPTGQRHLVTDELIADARLALAELRRRAEPAHVVIFGACRAGHVAAHCAALDPVDGLVLAGNINFDDHFRTTYRGAMPGRPRMADLPTMSVFDTLAQFHGPLLLIHGKSDPYMNPDRLLELAEAWCELDARRRLEMRIADGSDHTFSSRPREQIAITEAVAWLERRFGRGYPRAWQGPPPTLTSATTPRDEDPAAQVPRIALVGMVVPADDEAMSAGGPAWRLELPDGRAFGLNDSLRRVVTLIDGRRSVADIAAALSEQVGRPVASAQVTAVIRDRLAPMGIVEPDAREEGD